MTRAAEEKQRDHILVALLERTMPASTLPPEAFPDGLWDRALLDPLREFLRRPGKAFRARLTELGYDLAGGEPGGMPAELPLLLELIHAGSLIIDDIEDGSRRRRGAPALHELCGVPVALNAGNWLFFWPFELLSQIPMPPEQRLAAHDLMHACMARCHEGQALDLAARVVELEQREVPPTVAMVTALKTGSLVGLAMALGAVAADAPPARRRALHSLGRALGDGLQMLDDLSGLLNPRCRDKAIEDLRSGRPTWNWSWLAQELDADDYALLREHLADVGQGADPTALIEELSFRLRVVGRRSARRHVEQAFAAYEQVEGEQPALARLKRAFIRLERGYVEG